MENYNQKENISGRPSNIWPRTTVRTFRTANDSFALSLWDDTLQQVRGTSPSGAISWKTNSLPNSLKQQRIYTSTPKQQQQQEQQAQKQCSDATAKATTTTTTGQYIRVGGVKGQRPQQTLLLSFVVVIALIMPYNVQALDWWEEHQLGSKLSPLLCGILIATFSYGMVYMDSEEPGVNPPLAFWRGSNRRTSGWQLSYISALFVGVIVTVALYLDLWSEQFQ